MSARIQDAEHDCWAQLRNLPARAGRDGHMPAARLIPRWSRQPQTDGQRQPDSRSTPAFIIIRRQQPRGPPGMWEAMCWSCSHIRMRRRA
eukprot:5265520-Prymnesium_polylepis.1